MKIYRKYLVIGVIILFVGASVTQSISGTIKIKNTNCLESSNNYFEEKNEKFVMGYGWKWVTPAGSISFDLGKDICVDASGNMYVTGGFTETAYFDNIIEKSAGYYDIFVAKINSTGKWQWVQRAGGPDEDKGEGICLGVDGTVYVTGHFENVTTDWGSLLPLTSQGESDIFIAALDPEFGDWLWRTSAGDIGEDRGYEICYTDDEGLYITGQFNETVTFGGNSVSSEGEKDIFVAKADTNGAWQWGVSAGGIYDDEGFGICEYIDDNIYITGYFQDTAYFDQAFQLESDGDEDIFVAKLDSNTQTWLWANQAGSIEQDRGYDICVEEGENVYITGFFWENCTFPLLDNIYGQGREDVFVAMIDKDGYWQWAIPGGSHLSDCGLGICAPPTGSGTVYLTGYYQEPGIFGSININGYDWKDIFVARVEDGIWKCLFKGGNASHDFGEAVYYIGEDIGMSPQDIAVTGHFQQNAKFEPDAYGLGPITATNRGVSDIFVGPIGIFDLTHEIEDPDPGYIYFRGKSFFKTPLKMAVIIGGIDISVSINGISAEDIEGVRFYIDGVQQYQTTEPPYIWQWGLISGFSGIHEINARADTIYGYLDTETIKILKIF